MVTNSLILWVVWRILNYLDRKYPIRDILTRINSYRLTHPWFKIHKLLLGYVYRLGYGANYAIQDCSLAINTNTKEIKGMTNTVI